MEVKIFGQIASMEQTVKNINAFAPVEVRRFYKGELLTKLEIRKRKGIEKIK